MKPRMHMFRGRWYCMGHGVGWGSTPEAAYRCWQAVSAGVSVVDVRQVAA